MPSLAMVSVIMKLIVLNVIMMVETVVDLLFLVSPLAFFIVKSETMNLMATFFRMQITLMVCLPILEILSSCFSRRRWCSIRR